MVRRVYTSAFCLIAGVIDGRRVQGGPQGGLWGRHVSAGERARLPRRGADGETLRLQHCIQFGR